MTGEVGQEDVGVVLGVEHDGIVLSARTVTFVPAETYSENPA